MTNNVLIIDDDEQILAWLRIVARRAGYRADTAAWIASGRCWREAQPTLVFLDLALNRKNGVELLRRLQLDGLSAPVVLMTGSDRRVLRAATELAESFGFQIVDSLQKPFSAEAVTAILDRHRRLEPEQTAEWLEAGIAGDELQIHYQGIFDLDSGCLVGAEALARWRDARNGLLPPAHFIPAAEQTGLIAPLTRATMRIAIRDWGTMRAHGSPLGLAINLAPQAMADPDLADYVDALLTAAGVPPDAVTFEITETSTLETIARATETALRLRLLGCKVSLDDFGTGFSNLLTVRNLPLTGIKVDKAFVRDAASRADHEALARWVVELGRGLGLQVVAEGIETAECYELMRSLGVDHGQGFFLGRPMPFAEFRQVAGHPGAVPRSTARPEPTLAYA